jgi:hypothetical protein
MTLSSLAETHWIFLETNPKEHRRRSDTQDNAVVADLQHL